jgi:single-strand DNA-binding protein
MSVSKTILLGNLGSDPEIRTFDNGNKVANFSLATSENYTDKSTGEKKTITEWHRVSVFGKLADIIEQYVHKGDKLYLEGKNKTTKYTNKDGVDVYTTNVVLSGFGDKLEMLSSKPDNQSPAREQYTASGTPVSTFESERPDDNDDLPF